MGSNFWPLCAIRVCVCGRARSAGVLSRLIYMQKYFLFLYFFEHYTLLNEFAVQKFAAHWRNERYFQRPPTFWVSKRERESNDSACKRKWKKKSLKSPIFFFGWERILQHGILYIINIPLFSSFLLLCDFRFTLLRARSFTVLHGLLRIPTDTESVHDLKARKREKECEFIARENLAWIRKETFSLWQCQYIEIHAKPYRQHEKKTMKCFFAYIFSSLPTQSHFSRVLRHWIVNQDWENEHKEKKRKKRAKSREKQSSDKPKSKAKKKYNNNIKINVKTRSFYILWLMII